MMEESVDILVVEDDPGDAELTVRALREGPLARRVLVVSDGVEALDFLFCTGRFVDRDPTDLPRAIVLDLKLPTVGGLEVLKRVKLDPRTRMIPVVVVTGSKADADQRESEELGATDFVVK